MKHLHETALKTYSPFDSAKGSVTSIEDMEGKATTEKTAIRCPVLENPRCSYPRLSFAPWRDDVRHAKPIN